MRAYYRMMAGGCRTATDNHGQLVHAVISDDDPAEGYVPAMCGATPGRRSNGWSTYKAQEVTCPKCLKRMGVGVSNE